MQTACLELMSTVRNAPHDDNLTTPSSFEFHATDRFSEQQLDPLSDLERHNEK